MFRCLTLVAFALVSIAFSANHPDELQRVPGLSQPPSSRQYSGYLNASNGKYLHYWFAESQTSPTDDPLLLWLTGGPGCSSMGGLFEEIGPFLIQPDGETLFENSYSWNKFANVMFLESPIGVGYSYSSSGNYTSSDDTTATEEHHMALLDFFQKFPSFMNNDFYIVGESYSGMYIPLLAQSVLEKSKDINLKGLSIGNGRIDVPKLTVSFIFNSYNRGFIRHDSFQQFIKYCCDGCESLESCDLSNRKLSDNCSEVIKRAETEFPRQINKYNTYQDCAYESQRDPRVNYDTHRLMKLMGLPRDGQVGQTDPGTPCVNNSALIFWINQPSVRQALRIPSALPSFEFCSQVILNSYKQQYSTMKPIFLKLLKTGQLRILLYNGDLDMVCDHVADGWFVRELNQNIIQDKRPWFSGGQVAGFVTYYEGLTYTTIKGAGHYVPQDKPSVALQLLHSFLNNEPFPTYPNSEMQINKPEMCEI